MNSKKMKAILSESSNLSDDLVSHLLEVNDPSYCELRAIELVREARVYRQAKSFEQYKIAMKLAISMLAFARYFSDGTSGSNEESA